MAILWMDRKTVIYPWRSGNRLSKSHQIISSYTKSWARCRSMRLVFYCCFCFWWFLIFFFNFVVVKVHSIMRELCCLSKLHDPVTSLTQWGCLLLLRSSEGGLEETCTPLTCAWKQEAVVCRPGRAAAITEVGSSHSVWFTCSTMQNQLKIM